MIIWIDESKTGGHQICLHTQNCFIVIFSYLHYFVLRLIHHEQKQEFKSQHDNI